MLSISLAIVSESRELLQYYAPAYSDDYEKMCHDLYFNSNLLRRSQMKLWNLSTYRGHE